MASFSLVRLVNRKLIRITGPDCYPYLQGLLCNDLRYLYEPQRIPSRLHANVSSNVLSTFMLNAQGRVICDILLYRTPRTKFECKFTPPGEASEQDELLIECDAGLASGLANTLYGYRVRRKVALEILPDQQVWCLHPRLRGTHKIDLDDETSVKQLIELKSIMHKDVQNADMTIVSDPRIDMMGLRVLAKATESADQIKAILKTQIATNEIKESTLTGYNVHRYNLGLGEGPEDHPEGACFPLECNADLTGSVSFDKGCYLGQELTARIHFTGVIRKRLMPCLLDLNKEEARKVPILPDADIINATSGKKLGIMKRVVKNHGLALLRQDLIADDTELSLEATGVKLTTWRPHWWATG